MSGRVVTMSVATPDQPYGGVRVTMEARLSVAPHFEVFDVLAAGDDVERDVQDVVGLVIGKMYLEEVKIGVDIADQVGTVRQEEHGTDAAGA